MPGVLLDTLRRCFAAAAALPGDVGVRIAEVLRGPRRAVRRQVSAEDPVTGLPAPEAFPVACEGLLTPGGSGLVVVVDLRLLDQVHDALGHVRGETAVALGAERLAAACRDPSLPGRTPGAPAARATRLVGDTFAVVVPGIDPTRAHEWAEGLRGLLAAPCVVGGLPFEVPVVLGVAIAAPLRAAGGVPSGDAAAVDEAGDAPGRTDVVTTLLRRAEIALAAARRGGPGVRCYDPAMGERAARRRTLVREFGEALAHGHVLVHYQPLVRLDRRTVLGVEALARWEHPRLGSLVPDEFVPMLEATGQIGELTAFVLGQALGAARHWLDHGLRLSVAVNVSVSTLTASSFPAQVTAALEDHGVPPELLTLELTESGVSTEREAARPVLARLHALGCRLAVDDFGTGQSSFAHLRRLPVDQVKIDKSFVLGMETDSGASAVVRAIVEMGHTLGMTVVAEGVECASVRSALVEMGCDVAQGYLVSRPLSALCLERWMSTLAVEPGPEGPGPGEGPRTLIA